MDIDSVFYTCKCASSCRHITIETYKRLLRHRKIMAIVNYMQEFAKPLYIYGGYLRNLINGIDENDVDIYIDQDHSAHSWARYLVELIDHIKLKYKVKIIYAYGRDSNGCVKFQTEYKDAKSWPAEIGIQEYDYEGKQYMFTRPESYKSYQIQIDGILFDLHTQVNYIQLFKTSCDYTCNNLYLDGNLIKLRVVEPKLVGASTSVALINKACEDIKRKQLIWVNSRIDMTYRTKKMIRYGYVML